MRLFDDDRVWMSITLHTTPGVPEFLEPEVALVTAGVVTDVSVSAVVSR
jgi:hypothetical protein